MAIWSEACYLRSPTALQWFSFVWRCHGFLICPYDIHGVGILQNVRVDREVGRLGLFTRTSTLLCLVPACSHTLCCSYLCTCGHRAPGIPLALLLLGFVVCNFFLAAECAQVYVRPPNHASFRGVRGLRWFVFVSRYHGFPIRPNHIPGVGNLLFFLCSGLWCACFLAAECAPVYGTSLIPCLVPRCWWPLHFLLSSGSFCACCRLWWRAAPSTVWCASLISYHISFRGVNGL